MNKLLLIKLLLLLSTIIIPKTSFANFNVNELKIACSFTSNTEKKCLQEVDWLIEKNEKNSMVDYCFTNSDSIGNFGQCLKYEYNPLVFLKYKSNKTIDPLKKMNIENDIVKSCSDKDFNTRMSCLNEYNTFIEKSSYSDYWMENYCISRNSKLLPALDCYENLKRTTKLDNNLITFTSNLLNSIDKITNYVELKKKNYFEQIYKVCDYKYSDLNAYDCVTKYLNPFNDYLLKYELKNLNCLTKDNFLDFKMCVEKK